LKIGGGSTLPERKIQIGVRRKAAMRKTRKKLAKEPSAAGVGDPALDRSRGTQTKVTSAIAGYRALPKSSTVLHARDVALERGELTNARGLRFC
jgi:hypothetical protein